MPEDERPPRYPKVSIFQECFAEDGDGNVVLMYSRIEGDELRSFSFVVPTTPDNLKGINDAGRFLRNLNSNDSLTMEAILQGVKNLVALANGIPLVPRVRPLEAV